MKNKHEAYGLVINIAVVVLLFCFIVAGLNIIGIYSLPAPIEKLLGTYDKSDSAASADDGVLYNSVSFNENNSVFETVDIGYGDAADLLIKVSPSKDFRQTISVTRISGSKQRTEKMNVSFSDGFYSVDFLDDSDRPYKRVSEHENGVTVTEYNNEDQESSVTLEKGSFDISQECGFILSPQAFFESQYSLTEADFEKTVSENGSFLKFSFEDSDYGINQKYTYTVSLDYGIVTEVVCVENGEIVYEMKTSSVGFVS